MVMRAEVDKIKRFNYRFVLPMYGVPADIAEQMA